MAESVVSIAAERLGDLLVQEAKFLHGVSGQIELIQIELELMQTYLEDADKRQIQDKRVQTWISKIRETAYDVEDILETFILKIASRRRGGIKNAFKRYACILNEAAELHKVGSQIEDIKTRITTLTRCLQTYGIKHIREGEEGPSSVIERQRQWRQSYSHVDEEYTVGLEGDIKKLVEELLNEECRVVSICGMGGLGKTTLAKKIYRHKDIRRHFDCFAWAFISQQCQPKNILEGILFELSSPTKEEREEILEYKHAELVGKIRQFQQDNKCLVILDDIWTNEAWDDLCGAFPVGNKGSKILLTSRYDEVAEHVDSGGHLHKPRCLTEEEGWSLLQKKAFPEGTVDTPAPTHVNSWLRPCMEAWDSLRRAFPLGNSGSKILLTTRNKEVAVHVDSEGYLHQPQFPTEEEGWSLLQKKGFRDGTDGKIDEVMEMEKLGREMVKRCGFLPLAIAVLGGILATKRTKDEWKKVHDNINSYLRSGKGHEQQQLGVNEILSLSYYELPYQLKPCFLYLGHFPEDFNIPTKKLLRMWVAEGLVSSMQYEVKGAETLEDVAECYLEELLNRNMVQVGERGSTGRVKTCRLHDLMRDLCLLKVNEERIAIREANHENIFLKGERTPYRRSLLYTSWHIKGTYLKKMVYEFKLLRVLDLEECTIRRLPRAIGDLIHLRYLNFTLNEFSHAKIPLSSGNLRCLLPIPSSIGDLRCLQTIPSSIGNLRCLQTLIIDDGPMLDLFFDRDYEVPNIIWKMERLRHLCFPYPMRKNWVKRQLGNLRELQTLKNFDARHFDVKELTKLTNLRKLSIQLLRSLKELEGVLLISPSDSLNIGLRSLHIRFYSPQSLTEETDLQRLHSSCHQLRKLFLEGKIVKLPECSEFPQNLTKLSLQDSALEEDPMATLEKLPNLTLLSLQWKSFKGRQMTCSANGFTKLKSLQLCGLLNLEEWCVEKEAMRSLCKLEIEYCKELKMVPDGLRFITTLRELHIIHLPQEFQIRVKEGGDDYDKLKHVPSIIVK